MPSWKDRPGDGVGIVVGFGPADPRPGRLPVFAVRSVSGRQIGFRFLADRRVFATPYCGFSPGGAKTTTMEGCARLAVGAGQTVEP